MNVNVIGTSSTWCEQRNGTATAVAHLFFIWIALSCVGSRVHGQLDIASCAPFVPPRKDNSVSSDAWRLMLRERSPPKPAGKI